MLGKPKREESKERYNSTSKNTTAVAAESNQGFPPDNEGYQIGSRARVLNPAPSYVATY
jgi:hypothetical protein